MLKKPAALSLALILTLLSGCGNARILEKGYDQIKSGEIEAAVGTFETLVQTDPDCTAAYHGIVDAWLAAEDYDRAEAAVGRLTDALPSPGDTEPLLVRDEAGRRTFRDSKGTLRLSEGEFVTWEYDDAGRLKQATVRGLDGTLSGMDRFTYFDSMKGKVLYEPLLADSRPADGCGFLEFWNDADQVIGEMAVAEGVDCDDIRPDDPHRTVYVYDEKGRLIRVEGHDGEENVIGLEKYVYQEDRLTEWSIAYPPDHVVTHDDYFYGSDGLIEHLDSHQFLHLDITHDARRRLKKIIDGSSEGEIEFLWKSDRELSGIVCRFFGEETVFELESDAEGRPVRIYRRTGTNPGDRVLAFYVEYAPKGDYVIWNCSQAPEGRPYEFYRPGKIQVPQWQTFGFFAVFDLPSSGFCSAEPQA